jgi:Bardet-Biedl syndrome 5 protein
MVTVRVTLCHCFCRSEGDTDIIESDSRVDAWAAYCADGETAGTGREPVYCADLGLAIEAPRDGMTIQQLWSIL